MNRLLKNGYVSRVERHRSVGGKRGGSGEYVWGLGREGWKICEIPGRWSQKTATDYHALSVSSVYCKMVEDHRAGKYRLHGFDVEQESYRNVNGTIIEPDATVEIEYPGKSPSTMLLEIDMGTQSASRIRKKLEAYKVAMTNATHEQIPHYSRVVFVAHSPERRQELERIIKHYGNDDFFFWTATTDEFPDDVQ